MKIVNRYISQEFIKILLMISIGLTIVYMVVDIFENLSDLMKVHADLFLIALYFLLRLPQAVYYIVPLSILFASFLSLGLFTKYNEITAMRSGGLSILNMTSPMLIIIFILSLSIFFFNDSIVPATNMKAEEMKRKIQNRPKEMFFKEDSLWFKSDSHTLYNVRFIDPDKKIIWRISVYSLSPDFQIRESISADKAMSENGRWFLESGVRRVFDTNSMKVYPFDRLPIVFPFELQDIRHAVVQASETRFGVLRNYINKIRREGYEVKRLAVDLYAKTSFPFAGFIMSIFGISLAFHMRRYGGLAPGIGLCIVVSLLYWVCFSLTLHMGYSGYIPPLLSAWLSNLIFMAISGYLFYNATKF